MLRFLAKFLGRKSQTTTVARAPRLCVEELTPRVLPQASPFGAFLGRGLPAAPPAILAAPTEVETASLLAHAGRFGRGHGPGGPSAGRLGGATLGANLKDDTGATATVAYQATAGSLGVRVQGATASSTLDVTVNGTSVGTVTTDANGNGHARFTDVTAQAGAAIVIGTLQGTLSQVRFTATLTGAEGGRGAADYHTFANRLHLMVGGATANTTYDVSINGTVVGQLTTNRAGRGRFHLAEPTVTIESGSTISVTATTGGDPILQGTFA